MATPTGPVTTPQTTSESPTAARDSSPQVGSGPGSSPGGSFSSSGPLPPVGKPPTAQPPPPSASDLAFGSPGKSEPAKTKPKADHDDLFGDKAQAESTGIVEGIRDLNVAKLTIANPTWDPNAIVTVNGKQEKGGWVDATAARNATGTKSAVGSDKVDKRMVSGARVDPAQANSKLTSGHINAEELGAITVDQVAQVNPLSETPRNILKNALHQSWHEAKHHLLAPGDNAPARQMLMAKLWEFRQWHHVQILQRTQSDPAIGKEGLEEWKAAGSTTLTSDIDVNLKGSRTEQAVGVFNRKFKEDGFTKEAGVVYDVNVYAVDFMHKDTFKGLAEKAGSVDRHDFGKDASPTRVSAKEGSREGSVGGGVTETPMLADRMIKADADLQRVWSLVKMRLYMNQAEWNDYVRDATLPPHVATQVNERYTQYVTDLGRKMADAKDLVVDANVADKTGFQLLDKMAKAKAGPHGDAEEVKMAASNRLYEAKLQEMATVRTRVQDQIKRRETMLKGGNKDDAEGLDAAIDGNLAILRDLISECAMFSNEAYVTDGAVNHVVVGMQSKIAITQTKSESMDAFNENVGDSLKEIDRHRATLGEAAYKAGKYLWRMADAAQNLGVHDADIDTLYDAGNTIANKIKGGDGAQGELETKAAEVITTKLAKSTPDALMAHVRTLAAKVGRAKSPELAANGQQRAEPVTLTK